MNTIAPSSCTKIVSTIGNFFSGCCCSLNMFFRNCIYGNDTAEINSRERAPLLAQSPQKAYQLSSNKPITWAQKGGRFLTEEQRLHKMHNNLLKSIQEHKKNSSTPEVYIDDKQTLLSKAPLFSMLFSSEIFSEETEVRNKRDHTHFFVKISQGHLAAVFNGYRGSEVCSYAAEVFPSYFEKALKTTQNAHNAFERVFNEIQTNLYDQGKIDETGTTAVVCFLDNKHNLFTATLGDCEANLYRLYIGGLKCIPLSAVRTFSSASEVSRVNRIYAAYLNAKKEQPTPYFEAKDHTSPRYFPKESMKELTACTNLSRSLGNMKTSLIYSESFGRLISKTKAEPTINFLCLVKDMLIIHKPKITMHRMLPNDLLILACNGMFDNLQEKERMAIIEKHKELNTMIDEMAQTCIRNMKKKFHGANLTIIAIKGSLDDRHLY